MIDGLSQNPLPPLPILLWDTPPGLEIVLAQEGVAHRTVRDPHPLAFQGGRFVLYDGRKIAGSTVRGADRDDPGRRTSLRDAPP